MSYDVKSLHPLEVKVLRWAKESQKINQELLIKELDYNIGWSNQSFSWLSAKGLIEQVSKKTKIVYELTDFGSSLIEKKIVPIRIYNYLAEKGPMSLVQLREALGLEQSDVGSAFGLLSKEKICSLNEEKKAENKGPLTYDITRLQDLIDAKKDYEEDLLDEKDKALISANSKKRGSSNSIFRLTERDYIDYKLTDLGLEVKKDLINANITGEEVGNLTSSMLKDGSWKDLNFRAYHVNSMSSKLIGGRSNAYADYLRWVKDKLSSLGFQEFDGPLIENEFWNGDALFMPQFHSARDIHDVYYVKDPEYAASIEEPYLSNVAKTHEDGFNTGSRGWSYTFDRDFTRRQVLRSQGTVLSAKQLTKTEVPAKYFGVARCFRYDQVDATHGADFYQTEGIVISENVNLRTLLGLLKLFATQIAGAEEVRYVPGYFPFTEPSVEVHIKHPKLGWFELGGSGIFRPEVTKPLGIEQPVLAWGLGIDRMALMHLGLDDLRELFTSKIDNVRTRRGR